MINFQSITIEAKDIFDVFHNPVEIYINEEGDLRNIDFHDGDCADVYQTDGSQFLITLEHGKWTCRQFLEHDPHIDDITNNGNLVTAYGPYDHLDAALHDLIAKRNYITLN